VLLFFSVRRGLLRRSANVTGIAVIDGSQKCSYAATADAWLHNNARNLIKRACSVHVVPATLFTVMLGCTTNKAAASETA
jgi:hypothetical protein